MFAIRAAATALLLVSAIDVVCGADDSITVRGPESPDIAKRIHGYVLHAHGDEIRALSLPALKESIVRRMGPPNDIDSPNIHSLSGPDNKGRIAYIEDHFSVARKKNERHLLIAIQIDGTHDVAMFSRTGNAMWATTGAGHGEIGEHLALAPTGGNVAFSSALSDKQMPRALFHAGSIEIWNVVEKKRLPLKIAAIDQPMSWFPDGKTLAFVQFVSRSRLAPSNPDLERFGSGDYVGSWEELPAIHLLDTQSGKVRLLCLGWEPVVTGDGKSVFVGAWDRRVEFTWRRVDIETGKSTDVHWPGEAKTLIAAPAMDLAIYWGLPTSGAPILYTKHNSALRGPKLMLTIKAAIVNSNRFQTLIPAIDPRHEVSFGGIAK